MGGEAEDKKYKKYLEILKITRLKILEEKWKIVKREEMLYWSIK